MDFEETPQHIYTVQAGSDPSAIPALTPPPYEIATEGESYKPPAYDQVFSQSSVNICETGQESLPQRQAPMEMDAPGQSGMSGRPELAISSHGNPPPYESPSSA